MEVIRDLVSASRLFPLPGAHFLRLKKAYPCDQCKAYILARAKEANFITFFGGICHSGPLASSLWSGGASHTMIWQGQMAECSRCQAKGRVKDWP